MPTKKRPKDVDPYQAASTYWSLFPSERSWAEAASRLGLKGLDKGHQNYVARLVRGYEEAGFVKHNVLNPSSSSELLHRVPYKERHLAQEFRLRGATVVDLGLLRNSPQHRNQSKQAYKRFDYDLHNALARTASDVLLSLLRPEDVIGVGGGRSLFLTAQSLPSRRGLAKRVVSLTGQLSTQLLVDVYDERRFSVNTDADQVAQMIAAKFGVKAISKVNKPLASDLSPAPLPKHLDEVTLAIIGVGVLTEHHPLGRWDESEDLASIQDNLARLWEKVKKLDDGGTQHWCADVSNHLFIPIDCTESIKKPDCHLLAKDVAKVNKQTVTAKISHFQSICQRGSVILVAGGEHKLGAIQHILRQGKQSQAKHWVSHIVTDDVTAESLLAGECHAHCE